MLLKLYHWIDSKLNRKYIMGMASGLIAISLLFAALFISMYQQQLQNERANTSHHLNKLLQMALENSMLKRDLQGARMIIDNFGNQHEINNVMILNTDGEIRLATRKKLLGRVDQTLGKQTEESTHFIQNQDGAEILRSINPIHNRNECLSCHGPKEEKPINGVLVVDFDASILRKNARKTTLALMGAGSTVVLITLFGGWWFMGFFVLKPVHKLLSAQQAFTSGDLQTRVKLSGNDEISKLGNSFNLMAETIEKQWNSLEKRKQFLQSLIDGIPDGIRVLDQDYNVLLANQAYLDHSASSHQAALSAKCYAIHERNEPCIPTMETCPLYEINKNGKPIKVVHRHINANAQEISVEIFAAPLINGSDWGKPPMVIEVIRDLSKSVNFSQEQRLTSLGMLASGVAHEIHNPLGSIQMAFQSINQLIKSNEPMIDQLKYYITLIEGEIGKCVDITGRLLKLGNLPDTHLQPIEVNPAVEETLSLLQWEADSKNIVMKMDLPDVSPRILGTDNEFRMMILNLVQNAYHAMPEGGELTIRVITDNHQVDMFIEDTGVGISSKRLPQIFDPFFSHRSDHERGTGLGLSITKAIINRFNGTIQVSSKLGKGTRFTIILPDADSILETHTVSDSHTRSDLDKENGTHLS